MRRTSRRVHTVLIPAAIGCFACLLAPIPAQAASPNLVISQVYGGGGNTGATYRNDFIELYNRGSVAVNLTGWSIQYAAAAGSTWSKTDLSGIVQPGRYYLVQEALGAGGTQNLPTPDASGIIPMSATAGKVALVSNQTLLTCGPGSSTCLPNAAIVDFVGFGSTTSSYEGSGPTTPPTNTTAVLRADHGCTDTDDNFADFTVGTPNPRNSSSPAISCLTLFIHDIQGAGSTSPYVGQLVTTSGFVTAVKTTGFFLQASDFEVDGDPATSEGVFVSLTPPAVGIGDQVQVTGTVTEFVPAGDPGSPSLTQLGSATKLLFTSGNPLPAPVTLTAAETSPGGSIEQLERFEGMRVQVAALTVVSPTEGAINESNATSTSTGVFFGVIPGIPRPFREPGVQVPDGLPTGSPCCVPRFDANPERLRVDSDGQTGAGVLEVTTGATVTNVTGVLDYAFRAYTILPDPTSPPGVSGLGSAVAVRQAAQDEFTIGSFDVQRLFDTADDAGLAEPVLTAAAFDNRLNKLSRAIRNVMRAPDIMGIAGSENLATLQAVANRVNADAVGAGQSNPAYQAYLQEGPDPTGIDCGFLVKAARVAVVDVTQSGASATYVNPLTSQPELLFDRPPLVLRASVQPPAGPACAVTVVTVHLQSMSGIDGNGDGARVRAKRRAQAEFLANLVQARQASDPQEAIAVVGNFNAFEFNDGYVDMLGTIEGRPTLSGNVVLASADLVSPNLSDLVQEVARDSRYSFSLEGSAQTLDHVLVDAPLLSRSTGLAFARNGADFPESFRNDPARPERVSSHDMPVAYFRFGNLAVEPIPGPGLSGPIAIPNPMRERCELRFALEVAADVRLTVFDTAGRSIVELARGHRAAGAHVMRWNGRDRSGARVKAGLYFIRLERAGRSLQHRLVVLE